MDSLSTTDRVWNISHVILIGWLAVILAPFHKLTKYFVLIPSLFLSVIYTAIFLQTSFAIDLNFFELSDWLMFIKESFAIDGINSHLQVVNLWLAYWMVKDFYSNYTFAYCVDMDIDGTFYVKKSWTFGRVIFTLLLLLSYVAAPVAFLLYHSAKLTILKQHKTRERLDYENDQTFNLQTHSNEIQTQALIRRPVRFGDRLLEPFQTIFHILLGILGVLTSLFIVAPTYFLLKLSCQIKYRLSPSLRSQINSSEYFRNTTAEMKLKSLSTPVRQRKLFWHLKFYLLQITTFVEYIQYVKNPVALFSGLGDYFQREKNARYYAFGDGIGVNSYDLVKRYLQDLEPRKDFEALGWRISTSMEKFCDFTTIFLSSDDPDMKLGRNVVFKWIHAFPHSLQQPNSEVQYNLSRLVPRQIDQQPNKTMVSQALGEVMFYLATGGELRKHERQAYIECVTNPTMFFPDWFNFLLAGHYFERKVLNSFYVLLQAFSRYAHGSALTAAFKVAENQKSQLEVLRLITTVFSVAGSVAPAKLAYAVVERLWSDKKKYVPLYKKNPQNFIKECARLDQIVLVVSTAATDQIIDDIREEFQKKNSSITIPANTPIHCSLANANRDENIFPNPEEFNPDRPNLGQIIVWNGVEEDIMSEDESQQPIRYCPGHNLSLEVIQYVVGRFLPLISEENKNLTPKKSIGVEIDSSKKSHTNGEHHSTANGSNRNFDDEEHKVVAVRPHIPKPFEKERSCYHVLDNYTKLVMKLMSTAVTEANSSPSRGSDILQPLNTPVKDLGIVRIDMAKFIPTWDEDEPKGSKIVRKVARWLVNQNIWDFEDRLVDFNSLEQAIQWRCNVFSALPLPNVIYHDFSSDRAMTQLAFSSCACQYTHRVGKTWHPGHGIPDEKLLQNAIYVNDMTALSTFNVRQPFERYGAAAYFDNDYQIIGIYWSHRSRLVKPGEQFWEHAKYVWRSTFFAHVTICDHLLVTHMIECNAFVTASRKCLSDNHPLRRLVKPFTYHTISINQQAAVSLVNERGLVHRIWAFDYDEFLKVCDYISMNYKFRILPNFIHPSMTPTENGKTNEQWDAIYPIYHDLNAFWKIIQTYVTTFFHINYNVSTDDDNLPNDLQLGAFIHEICKQLGIPGITSLKFFIDVLSQLIASSTGIHEHVGQVSDYMIDPRFIGAKLQEGKQMQNIQTYSQILVLSVLTGLRMPGLLEDWSHLIERDEFYTENLENYRKFKDDLHNLADEIDHRNEKRNYPFQSLNPKNMECSTSV